MRGAVRSKGRWTGRRVPTQDPGTNRLLSRRQPGQRRLESPAPLRLRLRQELHHGVQRHGEAPPPPAPAPAPRSVGTPAAQHAACRPCLISQGIATPPPARACARDATGQPHGRGLHPGLRQPHGRALRLDRAQQHPRQHAHARGAAARASVFRCEVHRGPVKALFPRSIPPNFPVLARACLWCLGARMWHVNLPRGVKSIPNPRLTPHILFPSWQSGSSCLRTSISCRRRGRRAPRCRSGWAAPSPPAATPALCALPHPTHANDAAVGPTTPVARPSLCPAPPRYARYPSARVPLVRMDRAHARGNPAK